MRESATNSTVTTVIASAVVTVERLADWSGMAQGPFATNTLRAWKADWEVFTDRCRAFRLEALPVSPKTVRAFVFECLGKGKKPATVRRYVSTIGRAHRASGVLDPTASEDVRLALKEMGRNSTARQKQARGLTWGEIEVFLSIEPRNLRDIRDRALVAVAYDTMCRREELVSLKIGDIVNAADGSGSVLIRRSKTNTTGEGATAYLSPLTLRLVKEWITEAGMKQGAVDRTPERRMGEDFRPFCSSRGGSGFARIEHGFAVGDASG